MARAKLMASSAGFTLLEVMIAMGIMMVAFASILMVESSSINTASKAKQMNTVTMLAKNLMAETELEIRGKKFGEVKKEGSGTFSAPFENFSWKKEIKEVSLPVSALIPPSESEGEIVQVQEMGKQVAESISKSIREVIITISYKKGSGTQDYTVSTYWVDLGASP